MAFVLYRCEDIDMKGIKGLGGDAWPYQGISPYRECSKGPRIPPRRVQAAGHRACIPWWFVCRHVRMHGGHAFPHRLHTLARKLPRFTHYCAYIGYRESMISASLLRLLLYSFLDRGRSLTAVQLCTGRINNQHPRDAFARVVGAYANREKVTLLSSLSLSRNTLVRPKRICDKFE